MAKQPPSPDDADAPEIADASALFRDPPAPQTPPKAPRPGAADDLGQYEVEDGDEPPRAAPTSPFYPDEPRAASAPKDRPRASAASRSRLEPSEAVEQVWTRGAEWGGTLALLIVAAVGLLVLLYATLSIEMYGLAFLLLLGGGLVLAFLSYPILITLERPVRITPEQAVNDYAAALSHHFPHYRRMWLLLSRDGRVSGEFASFEGFRSYWKKRLAALKAGRTSGLTPLKFQVTKFRSEKSAGKTAIDASWTVQVFVRGRTQEGPIEEFRVSSSLVKGPDRMWYLDKGTLP